MYLLNRAIQQVFHKQLCNANAQWYMSTTKFNNNTTVSL